MLDQPSQFRFERFELDCVSHVLRKSGIRLKLEDQPFRLLLALVERRGEVLTREDLRGALWPEATYADFDRSLTRSISKVRTTLGDSAIHPRFIETLPRQGYRFVASVTPVSTPVNTIAQPEQPVETTPMPSEVKPKPRWRFPRLSFHW
jgi:DNA-binding winged helix-turn-helix (wHTH) protein